MFVYSGARQGLWHTTAVGPLLHTYEDLSREALVTVADLGLVQSFDSAEQELSRALEATRLESIDIALVRCDALSFDHPARTAAAIDALERLCAEGVLTGFGVHVSVPPFMHHTPRQRRCRDMSLVPMLLEESLKTRRHCCLVLYDLCASHQMPATHPMLEHPGSAEWAMDGTLTCTHSPCICEFVSACVSVCADELRGTVAPRLFSRAAADPLTCYRGLGQGGEEEEEEDERAVAERAQRAPLIVPDAAGEYSFPSITAPASPEEPAEQREEDVHHPLVLISGVNTPQLEHSIAQALDELCPALASTPRLEDKGLRVALSVGTELVVVEGNQSARIGKNTLGAEHMLTAEDSAGVFGSFVVPYSK